MSKYAIMFLFLSGCGIADNLSMNCHGDIELGCNNIFGYRDGDQDKKNKEQDEEIARLKSRLSQIEADTTIMKSMLANNETNITAINSNISGLQSTMDLINALIPTLATQTQINNLTTQYNTIVGQVVILQGDLSDLELEVQSLQTTVNNNITQIAIIQGYTHIVELLDPCFNSHSQYDEVFLRLSNGDILSSFSETASGLNTRFSVIEPSDSNVFQTTDHTSCLFKVPKTGINANKVCFGSGYATCI